MQFKKPYPPIKIPAEEKFMSYPAANIVILYSSDTRSILGGYKTCNQCGTNAEMNAVYCGQCGLQLLIS